MLTGDNARTAAAIAAQLGIERVLAEVPPGGKADEVRRLQEAGRRVAMVGDGVNDAAALAGAHVSIAMGGGTQLAAASADLLLLSEQLAHLGEGIGVARRTLAVIRQNLAWAVGYNLTALPFAAAGLVAPWMAAIGMSASSLIVVANALRLRGPATHARLPTAHAPR
jgi:Cu2+-exporting ATPase